MATSQVKRERERSASFRLFESECSQKDRGHMTNIILMYRNEVPNCHVMEEWGTKIKQGVPPHNINHFYEKHHKHLLLLLLLSLLYLPLSLTLYFFFSLFFIYLSLSHSILRVLTKCKAYCPKFQLVLSQFINYSIESIPCPWDNIF